MKTLFWLASVVVLSQIGYAASTIPSVSITSDAATRLVTVSYVLSGDPAIVTATVLQNGSPIGAENHAGMTGDVNVKVVAGAHRIFWRPSREWSDRHFENGEISVSLTAWALSSPPPYMVVDLTATNAFYGAGSVFYYASTNAFPGGFGTDLYKTERMAFKRIESAGVEWRMGSPAVTEEYGRAADEGTRYVTLSNDYYIGVYEVTQRQWELLMGTRPSEFRNPLYYAKRPVEKVSYDAIRGTAKAWPEDGHEVSDGFMSALRTLAANAYAFDLPPEALWEFACRAGYGTPLINGWTMTSQYYSGDLLSSGCRCVANTTTGSGSHSADCALDDGTNEVGLATPNAWGLYDMAGNVAEWCLDWYENNPIQDMSKVDPETGAATADVTRTYRVNRGGSWYGRVSYMRSARRSGAKPADKNASNQVGFRVSCVIPAE